MGNLFEDKNPYTEKNPTQADQVFTESFKGMTSEINRVANEKVTVWGLLVSWIYEKLFNNPFKVKSKQNEAEMYKSAKAFQKVQVIFSKEEDETMNNTEILEHTKKKFRP